MTRLAEILAGPWTPADQRRLDRFLKEKSMFTCHTRKTAYNATMGVIDELSRLQIHAKSSGLPLQLTEPELEQLRVALEEARELARCFERTNDWT